MFFSYLVLAFWPLMILPTMTHHLFEQVYEYEKTVIALDNGAIVLGRNDRSTFNYIEKTNLWLGRLEKIHHPVHAAVVAGWASAEVIATDQALELLMSKTLATALVSAQLLWRNSLETSIKEINKLSNLVRVGERNLLVPIKKKICSFCAMSNQLEIQASMAKTRFRVEGGMRAKGLVVELFNNLRDQEKKWDFRFHEK